MNLYIIAYLDFRQEKNGQAMENAVDMEGIYLGLGERPGTGTASAWAGSPVLM